MSDDDFEDIGDDDLFSENVDVGITERVIESLGGSKLILVQYHRVDGEDEEEDNVEEEGDQLQPDDDLNDNDCEDEPQLGSDNERGPEYPIFNPEVDFKKKIELRFGLKFLSNSVFRKALRNHAIENGYDYYYLHNSNLRVYAYCAKRCACPWQKGRKLYKCVCNQNRKCRFKVHCKKLKGEETFQIKSFRGEHICGHQHVNPKVSSEYFTERYLEDWRDDPCMSMKAFISRATREVQSEIKYHKAYNAKEIAMKMLFGYASEEYKKVWNYAAAIKKYDPRSTAIVKVTGIENPHHCSKGCMCVYNPVRKG